MMSETIATQLAELGDSLVAKNQQVHDAVREWDDCKKKLSEATKSKEKLQRELSELVDQISEVKSGRPMLPFSDSPPQSSPAAAPAANPDAPAAAPTRKRGRPRKAAEAFGEPAGDAPGSEE